MRLTVRRGITRTVLLAGRWAIKVPSLRTHDRGILASQSEREWSAMPGVCPVRWSLAGLVSVYPRCAPVRDLLDPADYDAIGMPGPMDRKHERYTPRPGEQMIDDQEGATQGDRDGG